MKHTQIHVKIEVNTEPQDGLFLHMYLGPFCCSQHRTEYINDLLELNEDHFGKAVPKHNN